jgi:ankyrin repeat protein
VVSRSHRGFLTALKRGLGSTGLATCGLSALILPGVAGLEVLTPRSEPLVQAPSGRRALMLAVERGDVALVRSLVKEVRDINVQVDGEFVLRRAPTLACAGTIDRAIVQLLLDSGANPDLTHLRTPALLVAASFGDAEMVQLLLRHGADEGVTGPDAETVLHLLAAHDDAQIVAKLIDEYGLNPRAATANLELRPLHIAAASGCYRVARELLRRGESVEVPDSKGRTPLLIAVEHGQSRMVEYLLLEGAGVSATSDDGSTAAHVAAELELEGVGKVLALSPEFSQAVAMRNAKGQSALHIAAMSRSVSMCELYSIAFTSCERPSLTGRTALHLAARFGAPESYRALKLLTREGDALDEAGFRSLDYVHRRSTHVGRWTGKLAAVPPTSTPLLWIGVNDLSDPPHRASLALWEDGAICVASAGERRLGLYELAPSDVAAIVCDLLERGPMGSGIYNQGMHRDATVIAVRHRGATTVWAWDGGDGSKREQGRLPGAPGPRFEGGWANCWRIVTDLAMCVAESADAPSFVEEFRSVRSSERALFAHSMGK